MGSSRPLRARYLYISSAELMHFKKRTTFRHMYFAVSFGHNQERLFNGSVKCKQLLAHIREQCFKDFSDALKKLKRTKSEANAVSRFNQTSLVGCWMFCSKCVGLTMHWQYLQHAESRIELLKKKIKQREERERQRERERERERAKRESEGENQNEDGDAEEQETTEVQSNLS